jgi:hypothetical protein
VNDARHLVGPYSGDVECAAYTGSYALGRIIVRTEGFGHGLLTERSGEYDIGESPANIDP